MLIDGHHHRLDLHGVGELCHRRRRGHDTVHRGRFVDERRERMDRCIAPLRFVPLILPLRHDDFRPWTESQLLNQRRVLIVIHPLGITRRSHHPAQIVRPVKRDALAIHRDHRDVEARPVLPARAVLVADKDLRCRDLGKLHLTQRHAPLLHDHRALRHLVGRHH